MAEPAQRNNVRQNAPPGTTLFYWNSGVFDTGGNLITSGPMDSALVRRLQSRLPEQGMLIVVDLVDTWIRPFSSERQRREMIDQILRRAPFLITKNSIFLVAKRNPCIRSRYKMADLEIAILDRQSASRILANNNSLVYS